MPAAALLRFDEIQHAAFLFSMFYQDSPYVPAMRAYSAAATAVAPNIDVDGTPMTGFITFAVGKVADVIVVNGAPAEHLSDVRKVEQVIRRGRWYDAQSIRTATGILPQ